MPPEARGSGDGRGDVIFSCFNQDQELDRVDFEHLRQRLRANSMQEKLSSAWLDGVIARHPGDRAAVTAPAAPSSGSPEQRGQPERTEPEKRRFAHDGVVWRRLARLGAAHGPGWFVEYSPPVIGLCAALLLPRSRRAVLDNLHRIRGDAGRVRDARDVAATFASYAGCLAEVLSNGSKNTRLPDLELSGRAHMERAIAEGKGVILVTAHTAGWELVGPVFSRAKGLDVVMVMEPERDHGARELHDRARRATGQEVAHVGTDPFASLPLLHRLREGAAVALQIDRVPDRMRTVKVRLFGEEGEIPEGPLRLAQNLRRPHRPGLLCPARVPAVLRRDVRAAPRPAAAHPDGARAHGAGARGRDDRLRAKEPDAVVPLRGPPGRTYFALKSIRAPMASRKTA